ncbi:hypothetical protein ABPG72_009430 [Tetrahymena utriculariae]
MANQFENSTMKQNRETYVGDKDPWTKQRQGKGVYTFQNSFFQYQGEWVDGKKHGQGILRMKDGTFYEGQFIEGEIEGYGKMIYANGNSYVGNFHLGEREGQGEFRAKIGEVYSGEWCQNYKHGKGKK